MHDHFLQFDTHVPRYSPDPFKKFRKEGVRKNSLGGDMHSHERLLGGHVTLATPPFRKILGVMSGLSLGTCMPNLKPEALTVLSKQVSK